MRSNPCLFVLLTLSVAPAQQAASGPSAAQIDSAVRAIDQIVERDLAAKGKKPNPIVDDSTFVRRAYLAIVGRIPTAGEVEAFARADASRRRLTTIDSLVGSPGHQSHQFHWWADLLRARTRLNRQVSGEPYMHWIKDALAKNKPYDAMVKELLVAEGPALARDNGATGYHLRDLAMPEDDMANTMRLFLGTRLECAQCHNHPFDKWKQKEFYELVAFNGGMQYRTDIEQSPAVQGLRDAARDLMQEHGQRAQQALRQIMQTATVGIQGSGTGFVRLPDNYQYPDAKPNQPVQASTPFGADVALNLQTPRVGARQPRRLPQRANNKAPVGQPADTRAAFAQWVVSADNPRFATVIANRLWKRTFGVALIEPLDDLRDDSVASSPELMQYLEKLIVDLKFDLRAFETVLLHTRLFQREVVNGEAGDDSPFQGPLLRRMTAEQMWDSLLTLVIPDLDQTLRPANARAEEAYARYEKLSSASLEDLKRELEANILRQTDPQKFRAMMRERTAAGTQEREAISDAKLEQARPLFRELAAARRRGDEAAEAKTLVLLQQLGVPLPGERARRNRGDQTLARASDLPSPAPVGHLLREFGQSDRDTIEAGHTEASVPQVLDLLNGFVDQRLLDNRGSVLRRAVDAEKDLGKKITAAFVALLARQPTSAELAAWRKDATDVESTAVESTVRDLIWVLLNSHEFRFIR